MNTRDLKLFRDAVIALGPAADDADRIERVRLLEEIKCAVAAAQALEAVAFERSQRAAQVAAGVPTARQGRGIASQLGLAMRVSPFRAQRWLGWAKVMTSELPATFTELATGRTSEWRTMLLARETAVLTREDRAVVDRELAPKLEGWGDARVEAETRLAAYRLDPAGAVERARRAAKDRRVTVRPAPDVMCRLTALVPVAQGVAAYAALCKVADSSIAVGDERGRGQIMADTLIERLTGQAAAGAVPTEIVLVMDEASLLARPGDPGRDEPALLSGYGPVPAGIARDLALGERGEAPRWLRRLYRTPATGELVAMDSRRRCFTANQSRFLRLRDQTCRTPWCDAPIRQIDHVRPWAESGRTTIGNAQGLCEACNHAKQAQDWHCGPAPGTASSSVMIGVITIRTPTGHLYVSSAPRSPGSPLEQRLNDRLRPAA